MAHPADEIDEEHCSGTHEILKNVLEIVLIFRLVNLWLCLLSKICCEMSDIKQHWRSLFGNSQLSSLFGWFISSPNQKITRPSQKIIHFSIVWRCCCCRSDIPIQDLLIWLIWHWMNSAYSGPFLNVEFSRKQLEHFRISFYWQVITRSIIDSIMKAQNVVLQYSIYIYFCCRYHKKDKATKTEEKFWTAPTLWLSVLFTNDFLSHFQNLKAGIYGRHAK